MYKCVSGGGGDQDVMVVMQVVAVEGINNYNGIMVPSRIYDEVIILYI